MLNKDSHISDEDLLLAADGELSPRRAAEVHAHLAACWTCRTRRGEIEGAISDFVQIHRRSLDPQLPPAVGPRSLLRARLAALAAASRQRTWPRLAYLGWAAVLLVMAAWLLRPPRPSPVLARSTPDPRLTPGAVLLVTRDQVCVAGPAEGSRLIPASVARQVFRAYGIANPRPRAYEVDYLVGPELGGSDDIHNFWPQPYSATAWNAHIKDALEDRLRQLVCEGTLDLATAQRDIATDWISAYKKYFHTDQPLAVHATFTKDRPWE